MSSPVTRRCSAPWTRGDGGATGETLLALARRPAGDGGCWPSPVRGEGTSEERLVSIAGYRKGARRRRPGGDPGPGGGGLRPGGRRRDRSAGDRSAPGDAAGGLPCWRTELGMTSQRYDSGRPRCCVGGAAGLPPPGRRSWGAPYLVWVYEKKSYEDGMTDYGSPAGFLFCILRYDQVEYEQNYLAVNGGAGGLVSSPGTGRTIRLGHRHRCAVLPLRRRGRPTQAARGGRTGRHCSRHSRPSRPTSSPATA